MNIYKRLIRHLYNKAFPKAEPTIIPTIATPNLIFKTIEPECLKSAVILFDYEIEQVERLYKDDAILYPDFVKSRLLDAMRDKIKEHIKVEEVIGYRPGTKEYIGTLKVIPYDERLSEVKT